MDMLIVEIVVAEGEHPDTVLDQIRALDTVLTVTDIGSPS